MATAPMNLSYIANDSQISQRARGIAKIILGLALLVLAGALSARKRRIGKTRPAA